MPGHAELNSCLCRRGGKDEEEEEEEEVVHVGLCALLQSVGIYVNSRANNSRFVLPVQILSSTYKYRTQENPCPCFCLGPWYCSLVISLLHLWTLFVFFVRVHIRAGRQVSE